MIYFSSPKPTNTYPIKNVWRCCNMERRTL